jgi:hypothetical protein
MWLLNEPFDHQACHSENETNNKRKKELSPEQSVVQGQGKLLFIVEKAHHKDQSTYCQIGRTVLLLEKHIKESKQTPACPDGDDENLKRTSNVADSAKLKVVVDRLNLSDVWASCKQ